VKVGDLVVRIWLGQPKWDMIGIIVSSNFNSDSLYGPEWIYGIKWNKQEEIPKLSSSTYPFGQWTEKEIEVISESR